MGIRRIAVFILVYSSQLIYAQAPSDTKVVQGDLDSKYNNPFHNFIMADLVGFSKLPTVSGSSPILGVSPAAAIAPYGVSLARVRYNLQFSTGLYTDINSKLLGNVDYEFGVFPLVIKKQKAITFQGGHNGNIYTWQFNVKRNFCIGLVGGYSSGKYYFQTGNDTQTALRWNNAQNPLGNGLSVPVNFGKTTFGIGVITTAWAKNAITTDLGKKITRRYKAFTEISAIVSKLNYLSLPSTVTVKPQGGTQVLSPAVLIKRNYGFGLRGTFRRKLLAMNLEFGSEPGIEFRFDGGEGPINLNRTYLKIGLGLGWM